MVAALAPVPPFGPMAIEHVLDRLPAGVRARFRWLRPRLKADFLEPMRALSSPENFAVQFEQLHAAYQRLLVDAAAELLPFVSGDEFPELAELVHARRTEELVPQIAKRIEAVDAFAADELLESFAWLDAAMVSLCQAITHEDLRQLEMELQKNVAAGDLAATPPATSFTKAAALFAALEAFVLDDRPLPALLSFLCDELFMSVMHAARDFRGIGIDVGPLRVPGRTPAELRQRWMRHVVESLPDDKADEFIESLW